MSAEDQVPAAGGRGGVAVLKQVGRTTTVVASGMMTMNLLTYGFTLLAAHLLGPVAFGGLTAILGVLIIANVGSVALQTTGARRLATAVGGEHAGTRRDVVRSGWFVSAGVALLLGAATPLMWFLLRIHDPVALALLAVSGVPLTITGAYSGIAQGDRRWPALSTIYLATGAGRMVCGAAALVVSATLRSAVVGVTIGSVVAAVVGWALCRPPRHRDPSGPRRLPLMSEMWRNGHTLLALFAFTNLDVLVARHLLTHHEAGIYAAGAVITKACMFLPTFVLVLAFPTMAARRRGRPWLLPAVAICVLGGCAMLVVWALPWLAVDFAGGHAYADLTGVAWVFAFEGTAFALLQLLTYDTIAGQAHLAGVLWAGVVVAVAVTLAFAHSVGAVVAMVSAVAVVLTLLTAVVSSRRHGQWPFSVPSPP